MAFLVTFQLWTELSQKDRGTKMKYVLILLLAVPMNTYAMPKYLEGATVTVTLKNGKTYTYASEDMAVVPRKNLGKHEAASKAHLGALKVIDGKITEGKIVRNKKNRLYILGGYGNRSKLKHSTNGQTFEVKHRRGFVGGVGYQRKLNEDINAGVQIQTNGTSSLSLGTDF